ncbi:hypothetical protein FHT40_006078 [Mycolicibacterium sp. BK556]|uniref:hypothetical protein n=1 Tax=unclassified Mycolicibacterium TaxID=2636767 RepID=UPI001615272F|nr:MULTISPECIES: hypothetical protein [unclassified Mycolicibacterium]MBB3606387.1 hypothetical protein [Mycolicibacterium sp. BK556]MBB3636367.1 hypothetical protein [Mycolicibacterium sp. BK607]
MTEGGSVAAPLTEAAARALVAGHLEALLDRREQILNLDADQVRRLADLAIATRADCGGNACG